MKLSGHPKFLRLNFLCKIIQVSASGFHLNCVQKHNKSNCEDTMPVRTLVERGQVLQDTQQLKIKTFLEH